MVASLCFVDGEIHMRLAKIHNIAQHSTAQSLLTPALLGDSVDEYRYLMDHIGLCIRDELWC